MALDPIAMSIEVLNIMLDMLKICVDLEKTIEKKKLIIDLSLIISSSFSVGLGENKILGLSLQGLLEHDAHTKTCTTLFSHHYDS